MVLDVAMEKIANMPISAKEELTVSRRITVSTIILASLIVKSTLAKKSIHLCLKLIAKIPSLVVKKRNKDFNWEEKETFTKTIKPKTEDSRTKLSIPQLKTRTMLNKEKTKVKKDEEKISTVIIRVTVLKTSKKDHMELAMLMILECKVVCC